MITRAMDFCGIEFCSLYFRSLSTIKQTLHQSHTVLGMIDNTSLLFINPFYHRMTSQTTKLTHALNSQQENEANIFCKKSLHKFFFAQILCFNLTLS